MATLSDHLPQQQQFTEKQGRFRSAAMARIELFRQLNASKPATNTNSREGLIRSLWHQVAPSLRHDQALALEPRVVRALEDCTSLQHETLVQRIFYSPPQLSVGHQPTRPDIALPAEELTQFLDDDGKALTVDINNKTSLPTMSIQQLQEQQREQMEEAVAHMAAQMKAATERIHSQLQRQTIIDDLDQVATQNTQAVVDVTKDVRENVSKGWKRTIGTWAMLFTMLAAFAFCVVMIFMVPKRKYEKVSNEFCRTLSHGRRECMNIDDMEQQKRTIEAEWNEQRVHTVQRKREPLEMSNSNGIILDESRHDYRNEAIEGTGATEVLDNDANEVALDDDFVFPEIPRQLNHEDILSEYMETLPSAKYPSVKTIKSNIDQGNDLYPFDAFQAEQGATPDVPVLNGRPFSARDVRNAASSGNADLLRQYLEIKPEFVDEADSNGFTALHLATRNSDIDVIRTLLEFVANEQLESNDGFSAVNIVGDLLLETHEN